MTRQQSPLVLVDKGHANGHTHHARATIKGHKGLNERG
jgi:hypothetical protein